MMARMYILLDVAENAVNRVISTVRSDVGTTMVDALEVPPDNMLALEARGRHKLAELTTRVLASVQIVTEGITVLPSRDCYDSSTVK